MHLSQDLEQRLQMTGCVMFELYRIMVSSFLIIFVPQKCGNSVCTYSENLSLEYPLYTGGLVVNFATMALFLFLYAIEIKRENRLITYLEVTPSKPSDNESVGKALEHLSVERRENIWNLDMKYRNAAYAGFILFLANAILSGCVVYEYYLDGQTTTTYITNILFMIMKLKEINYNVSADRNIFYSAYLRAPLQYNDVDPDKTDKDKIGITDVEEQKETEKPIIEVDVKLNVPKLF